MTNCKTKHASRIFFSLAFCRLQIFGFSWMACPSIENRFKVIVTLVSFYFKIVVIHWCQEKHDNTSALRMSSCTTLKTSLTFVFSLPVHANVLLNSLTSAQNPVRYTKLVSYTILEWSKAPLNQAWRTAEPIRIQSAVSYSTSRELNSVNSIRLMWSTASEPSLKWEQNFATVTKLSLMNLYLNQETRIAGCR